MTSVRNPNLTFRCVAITNIGCCSAVIEMATLTNSEVQQLTSWTIAVAHVVEVLCVVKSLEVCCRFHWIASSARWFQFATLGPVLILSLQFCVCLSRELLRRSRPAFCISLRTRVRCISISCTQATPSVATQVWTRTSGVLRGNCGNSYWTDC